MLPVEKLIQNIKDKNEHLKDISAQLLLKNIVMATKDFLPGLNVPIPVLRKFFENDFFLQIISHEVWRRLNHLENHPLRSAKTT